MGEGPSRDVVIGRHDVRREETVGIQVHVEEPKCSSKLKPWRRMSESWVSDSSHKINRAEGPHKRSRLMIEKNQRCYREFDERTWVSGVSAPRVIDCSY